MSDSQSSQDQIKQYLDLLNQQIRQPAAMPTGTPDDGSSPSWTGLLGRALSGGQAPGYQLRGSQADTSGNRALLNFGINTLLASGPHAVRPDLLSSLATGLQGAQESLGQDQARAGALAGAQYTAARQQQQDRMAALKEALPLLTLQQKSAAIAGTKPPWETGAPGTTGDTSGGFTGDKTKDLALIAQRESGGNPTILNHVAQEDPTAYARGATASGKYQIVNSTWAEGLKLAGLDPAQYATARDAPEAVQDKVAGALYDKYGSKPWVKGAKDWVKDENGKYQLATVRPQAASGATPPAPGAPGTTPPPVAAAPPAPAPAASALPVPPIPPPGGGTRPTAPPPGAPAAPDVAPIAGNQFAGPGAPSGGAPRPPGPAVAGNVGAIVGGMKGAGADPTTLAPPPSSPPGGPPAAPGAPAAPTNPAEAVALAVKTGQPVPIPGGQGLTALPNGNVVSTPPPAAPGAAPPTAPPPLTPATPGDVPATFEEYQRQHPIVVPPEMQALFKTGPNADALAILKQQEQGYRSEWLQAKADMDPAAMAKATEAINTVRAKQAELIQSADKQGGDAQAKYLSDQTKIQQEIWQKARDAQEARAAAALAAQRTHDLDMEKLHATAAETRLTNKEAVVNSVNQKGLETANAEQASSIGAVRQLEGFRSVSEMVGQPDWLQTTKFPGSEQSIAEKLQQLGYKVDDTQGVQLMRGAMTNLTRTLREGMPMGALSDRDLSFIERMGPTEWMDPETRIAAVDYLQKAFRAKQRFSFEVQSAMGKGMNHGDALDAANEKVKDFVPRVTPELAAHWNDNSPEWKNARQQWAQDNDVRPGTMYHFPNGSVAIMKRPKPAGAP